jgi:DnaJ-class molecular chaperone with C-terminal Zn finger domain
MSHYETLGVKPDADAAEIKRAYRKRAERAHPDKQGGNQDEMMAVNHAFDVLGDPKRRLLYDATGQDSQRPIEEQSRGLLMQGFQQALAKGSHTILKDVRWFVKEAEAKTVESQRKSRKAIKELQSRRKKIKTKGKENVFHMIVDGEIHKLEQNIAVMDEGLKVVAEAFKALDEYESSEKEPERASALNLGYVYTSGNF